MNFKKRVLDCFFILLALTATGYSQNPIEGLSQQVVQLQKTPTDNVLREKIIKFAAEIKPAPAVPDEAIRFEGRAQFAFKDAKSVDEYLGAAREYEKAVAAAPWVLGYYSDLCTIYEKAAKYDDAKRNCGFYLIGLSDPAQITEAKRRIAGLEFGIEKALSARAEAERAAKAKAESENEEKLIIPDSRVGRVRIGMTPSQVEQILGRPVSSRGFTGSNPGGTYEYKSFSIVYDERMTVYRILTTSPEFRTRAGISVGSLIDDARREWGSPQDETRSEGRVTGEARVSVFYRRTAVDWDPATRRILAIEVWAPQ